MDRFGNASNFHSDANSGRAAAWAATHCRPRPGWESDSHRSSATKNSRLNREGFKQLNYSELPYLMLQAIRELKARNDNLAGQVKAKEAQKDAQIRKLTRQVRQLQTVQRRLEALEARLAQVEAGQGKAQATTAQAGAAQNRPVAAKVQF